MTEIVESTEGPSEESGVNQKKMEDQDESCYEADGDSKHMSELPQEYCTHDLIENYAVEDVESVGELPKPHRRQRKKATLERSDNHQSKSTSQDCDNHKIVSHHCPPLRAETPKRQSLRLKTKSSVSKRGARQQANGKSKSPPKKVKLAKSPTRHPKPKKEGCVVQKSSTTPKPTRTFVSNPPAAKDVKPAAKEGKLTAKEGKPAAKDGRPATKDGKPAAKNGEPTVKDGKPAAKNGKPMTKNEKPAAKDGKRPAAPPKTSSKRRRLDRQEPPTSNQDTVDADQGPRRPQSVPSSDRRDALELAEMNVYKTAAAVPKRPKPKKSASDENAAFARYVEASLNAMPDPAVRLYVMHTIVQILYHARIGNYGYLHDFLRTPVPRSRTRGN